MELRKYFKRDIVINKEMRDRYENLSSGIFKDRDLKNIFMLSLALGDLRNNRKPITNPTVHITMNSFSDEDILTMIAIAIQDQKNIQVINDGNEIKRIAIEYSNAGLDELEELVTEYGYGENLEYAIEKRARDALSKISYM